MREHQDSIDGGGYSLDGLVLILKGFLNNNSMEIKQIEGIIGYECKHAGQHGPYTDSTYEYVIKVDKEKEIPEQDLLIYCFSLVGRKKIQSQKEWSENLSNPHSYFSGYYTLNSHPAGYFFKFVSPYTD